MPIIPSTLSMSNVIDMICGGMLNYYQIYHINSFEAINTTTAPRTNVHQSEALLTPH